MSKITVQCRGNRVFSFSPENTALLVIDLQQEFFVEATGECMDEMRAILPRVELLIDLAPYYNK